MEVLKFYSILTEEAINYLLEGIKHKSSASTITEHERV